MSTQSRLFLPLLAKALAFPLNDPVRVLSAAALETAISQPEAKTPPSSVTFKSAALSSPSLKPTVQRGLAKRRASG